MYYARMMDNKGYVFPDKIKNALLGLEEKGKTIMFYFDKLLQNLIILHIFVIMRKNTIR